MPLDQDQLVEAAESFYTTGIPDPLHDSIEASVEDLPVPCREAQNTLWAAINSADNALIFANTINRLLKTIDRKAIRGRWSTPAEDNLRAAVLFAGAGLDRSLKSLVEDALPILVESDTAVQEKLRQYAEGAIAARGAAGVDPAALVRVLLGTGRSPRTVLAGNWAREMVAGSAQSADRVSEIASTLGVTDPDIRRRISPTKGRTSTLEKAFSARNQIAHELDVTKPQADARQKLERFRRARSVKDIREYTVELLTVPQLIINDVAGRLAAG